MKHRFSIENMLLSAIGYKGTFYPGIFANIKWPITRGSRFTVDGMVNFSTATTSDGAPIKIGDKKSKLMGAYVFMPVIIDGFELPNAVISVAGKKTIMETPMVGQQGSVKELIGMDDYEITISGVIISDDDSYPEKEITEFINIWKKNDAVKLVSALTSLIIGSEDIVIKSVDFPPVGVFENAQIVNITAVSDYPLTLTIE